MEEGREGEREIRRDGGREEVRLGGMAGGFELMVRDVISKWLLMNISHIKTTSDPKFWMR